MERFKYWLLLYNDNKVEKYLIRGYKHIIGHIKRNTMINLGKKAIITALGLLVNTGVYASKATHIIQKQNSTLSQVAQSLDISAMDLQARIGNALNAGHSNVILAISEKEICSVPKDEKDATDLGYVTSKTTNFKGHANNYLTTDFVNVINQFGLDNNAAISVIKDSIKGFYSINHEFSGELNIIRDNSGKATDVKYVGQVTPELRSLYPGLFGKENPNHINRTKNMMVCVPVTKESIDNLLDQPLPNVVLSDEGTLHPSNESVHGGNDKDDSKQDPKKNKGYVISDELSLGAYAGLNGSFGAIAGYNHIFGSGNKRFRLGGLLGGGKSGVSSTDSDTQLQDPISGRIEIYNVLSKDEKAKYEAFGMLTVGIEFGNLSLDGLAGILAKQNEIERSSKLVEFVDGNYSSEQPGESKISNDLDSEFTGGIMFGYRLPNNDKLHVVYIADKDEHRIGAGVSFPIGYDKKR